MPHLARRVTAGVSAASGLAVAAALVATPVPAQPAAQAASAPSTTSDRPTVKDPTAVGKGGAVSTVDPEATAAGLEVLKRGRQRGRRRGRDGGGARCHRALQRRHRRRRLLRLLRREDRQGRAPSTAARPRRRRCRTTRSSTRRPASPTTSPPSWSPAASRVGVPGTLATWDTALDRWGTLVARRRPSRRPPRSRVAASWSTRPSASRPSTTRSASRRSPRPAELFLPGGDAPEGRLDLPQPRPRRHLRPDRRSAAPGVLPRHAGRRDRRRRCASRRRPSSTDLPVPAGLPDARATSRDYRVARPARRRTSATAAYDVYGMAPSSSRRHHRRRGAQHPRALRPRRR